VPLKASFQIWYALFIQTIENVQRKYSQDNTILYKSHLFDTYLPFSSELLISTEESANNKYKIKKKKTLTWAIYLKS
jgi:hypothetical protein